MIYGEFWPRVFWWSFIVLLHLWRYDTVESGRILACHEL